jgi:Flp pilus assembly secretin CpaC
VRVLNGGTVALAGLTQDKSVTTKKRTPGLSNLPLVGALFNNSDDITTSREVAVFVTAHILDQGSPQAAGFQSAARQNSSTPSELNFNRPQADQGFNRPPVNQGFNRPPVDQGFNRPPVNQGFNRPPATTRPNNTQYRNPAPVRPMGNDFKSQLGKSLSGNQRR